MRRTATLRARRPAGGPLWLATLDVPREQADAYVAPGQYIQVLTPSGNGYFALASEPGQTPFELLVRNNGDASAVLTTAELGTLVDVDGPLGGGFPIARSRGRALVVAVAGSALAVARALMEERFAHGDGPTTHLFVGVRAPEDLPIQDELERWAEQTQVTLCLSRAEITASPDVVPRAARTTGYVQHALARALRPGSALARAAAPLLVFAAGPAAMLDDVRALAALPDVERAVTLEVVANA